MTRFVEMEGGSVPDTRTKHLGGGPIIGRDDNQKCPDCGTALRSGDKWWKECPNCHKKLAGGA